MIKKELCFRLIKKTKSLDEDFIIDSFIDFAVDNSISISGNVSLGFCFCTNDQKEINPKIKKKFLHYLNDNFSNFFKSVIFQEYDLSTEEFLVIEEKYIE